MPRKNATKIDGVEQITMLGALTQQAAAHLIDLSPRQLRDCRDVPRREDGLYDGPELVKWAKGRAVNTAVADEDFERCLLIGCVLSGDREGFASDAQRLQVFDELTALRVRYGPGADAAIVGAILDALAWVAEDRGEISRRRTDAEILSEARKSEAIDERADKLRYLIVCEECSAYRVGRSWRKGPKPTGYDVLKDICPSCRNK